jgi:hypothetical protein
VLTEEKLDYIGARLEHMPRKSLKLLVQDTGVSRFSARREQWYCTPCSHAIQIGFIFAVGFYSLSSKVNRSAVDIYFDEAWFHLEGYINMQNDCYWSSQNPHRTHKVLLHPVKVGVWCAVSARRIVGPVYF